MACLWEELFHRASPAQQDALLALAARQGILYAHQIAPPENGPPAARRSLLPALLNGQIKDLQSLRPARLEPLDGSLDDVQRDAVARALRTPDVCLIQGLPGTGKSRVVAEIVRQAAARGERTLLLAPTTAALDRVLEQVGGAEGLFAVRCPAPQEAVAALPPCIRRLTVAERLRQFEEGTLPTARQAIESARQSRDDLRAQEPAWKRLEELLPQRVSTAEQVADLEARRQRVPAEVEGAAAELEPVAAAERVAREKLDQFEGRQADLRTEAEKNTHDLQQADAELQRLTPLAEARCAGRWWSVAWWRALGKGDVLARRDELRKRRDELQADADRLARQQAQLDDACRQVEESCRAERARLCAEETARRQADLDTRLTAARQELARLDDGWRSAGAPLGDAAPARPTAEGFESSRAAWSAAAREVDEELSRARQWAEDLESARGGLPDRIVRCANLVAATTTALVGDPHFGDHNAGAPPFDLLVLEEADEVTESEFVHAARRARRWVLVGEPVADAEASDALPCRAAPAKPLRPAALRPGFFQRLWHHLHADPRRLPFAWTKREGRLVCHLRAVPPEQQAWVESEAVADRPEIELRIVSPPRQPPQLVEVVFPAAMGIHEAKEYIFRELGEVPLQARGAAARWHEEAGRVLLWLGTAPAPDAVPVALGQGVRELVGCDARGDGDERFPWHTCGLEFDREAGWTLERARQWVEEQVKLRDLGRTAFLGVSYRMQPTLARVLSDFLHAGDGAAGQPPFVLSGGLKSGDGPCVEFVAVPTLPPDPEPRRRLSSDPQASEPHWQGGGTATAAPRLRAPRGGAGLEVDLADPRRLEPLPADLRAQLPGQGLVNYLEAQAVVRHIEALAAAPDVLAAAAADRCPQPDVCHADAHCPVVAVMAPYLSQVELIRRLVQRSAALASCPVRVEVGLPSAFRHRDCHVAVVSLTRSHTHRAVTYGDHPRTLVQALTRPRARLVMFGDPGTLARRSQWQGPVDHLDETAAGLERGLASQLLRYIQGNGAHPHAFQFREGSSV
jgi:hypothetical protein